ncbi:MAG: LysR family transcriptional regulator [Chitinophagaceae bacterium]|nr:LysR family transcriptional regulator [Oligoflexus sp.]
MSLLARLNLNYLRIFLVVYRTRSMTLAAKQLHLTQSGVSQQIKSLEDTLGIILFDRINRKILPTSEADLLYAECSRRLDDLEDTLHQISKQDGELLGRIKVGVSPTLHGRPLIKLLADFAHQHPKVKFEFKFGPAADITEWFEDGKIDFALVDAFVNEPNLDYEEIASDPYVMVGHDSLLREFPHYADSYEQFTKLPFVQYLEAQELMNAWFKKNWGRLPKDINVRARVMDIQSCVNFIRQGIGVGLVPDSYIREAVKADPTLQAIHLKAPVSNRIRVAFLQKRTMGLTAKFCIQWLQQSLDRDKESPNKNKPD